MEGFSGPSLNQVRTLYGNLNRIKTLAEDGQLVQNRAYMMRSLAFRAKIMTLHLESPDFIRSKIRLELPHIH